MNAVRHNQAISAALTLASSPALMDVMRRHKVPDDVEELLAVFSGDDAALDRALAWSGARELQLTSAIENYVQQVLAFEGANPLRVLGLKDGRDREQMRVHFRLLLKGCHPDQSGDPWRAAYAARVIEAWKAISGGQETPQIEAQRKRPNAIGHLSFIHRPDEKPKFSQRVLRRMSRLNPFRIRDDHSGV